MCDLTHPIYNNPDVARKHLESIRWPDGPICPHCGVVDKATKLNGKSTRPGVYKCRDCRKPFSVTVGTVFERSKIPLNKWVLATHLMASSKKGISSHQIHRTLGVTYKTAWFMSHRIREAMRDDSLRPPLGGEGEKVEVDETFIGRKRGVPMRRGTSHKMAVLSLVERGGKVRSFPIANTKAKEIGPIVNKNIAQESQLMTDEAGQYQSIGKGFKSHGWVTHSAGEYVDGPVHTNTVEGYFSIFKRGMKGVYQHCHEDHLHRYLAEFDFRYNNRSALEINDVQRAEKVLEGVGGKRLTYR